MVKKKDCLVAFYGAGATAISLFNTLNRRYNIICFCDSDKRKQGGQLLGLPVFSLEEALNKYSGLHIYVSTNDDYKFDIMEMLINGGFPKEHIVNYEPYRKYVSCRCLETRIGFSERMMNLCPSSFGRHQSPLIPYTQNPEQNVRNFIHVRNSIIDIVSSDVRENQENQECTCIGCPELKERYWAVNRRINDICFGVKYPCNFRCSYCVQGKFDKSSLTGNEHLDEILDTMRLMSDKGIIDELAIMGVAPTEIGVHPYRDKILEFAERYVCQFVTNASVYVDAIAASLARNGKLFTSLDAGTPETFRKIKGVDKFRLVCDNVKRYAQAGDVEIKYIFLPGVNDNEADVDGFVDACETINPVAIHISRNMDDYGKDLPEHTLNMIARMIQKGSERGLPVNCSPLVFLATEYNSIQSIVTAANQ